MKTELQFSLCLLNIQSFGSWRPLKADPGFQTSNPGLVFWSLLAGEFGEIRQA